MALLWRMVQDVHAMEMKKKLKGGQLKAESNMGFSFLAFKLQNTYTRSASSKLLRSL
jgi:hypothetical protein